MDIVKKYGAPLTVFLFLLLARCDDNGPAPSGRGFMWKATHGNNTAYLFGSLPVGVESMYPLSDAVYEALDKADSIYTVEFRGGQKYDFDGQTSLLMQDEDQPIEGKKGKYEGISDSSKAKLIKIIGKKKYDDKKNNFEPQAFVREVAVAILSKQPFLLGQDSIKLEFSPTWAIVERVRETKGIGGAISKNSLDDVGPMVALTLFLDTLSPAEQISYVEKAISCFDCVRDDLRELIEFYRGGRIDKIVQYLREDKQRKDAILVNGKSLWELFEADQNKRYAKKIAGILSREEGKVSFMVLKITHWLGEEGTIEELKRTLPGVRVERVVP